MSTNKKRVQGYLSEIAYQYLENYKEQQELKSVSSALEILLESLADNNSKIGVQNDSSRNLKMDKFNYFKRSQELNFPLRCPFIQYCQRYALSVYSVSYNNKKNEDEEITDFLKRKHELPSDYDDKKIEFCGEPISWSGDQNDTSGFSNLCPELALFTTHRALASPKEAISSYTYSKNEGFRVTEHKHFSECLEFIRATYFSEKG